MGEGLGWGGGGLGGLGWWGVWKVGGPAALINVFTQVVQTSRRFGDGLRGFLLFADDGCSLCST